MAIRGALSSRGGRTPLDVSVFTQLGYEARAVVRALGLLPDPPISRDEAEALFEESLCDSTEALRTFGLRLRPFEVAMREALRG